MMTIANFINNKQKEMIYNGGLMIEGILVHAMDNISTQVDYLTSIKNMIKLLPSKYKNLISAIYIGEFSSLVKRDVSAAFRDGAIYILDSEQNNAEDLLDDLIHEMAHAVENEYNYEIYGDDLLVIEFLKKRQVLGNILESYGYNIPDKFYSEDKFDEEIDTLLFNEIGYTTLEQYIGKLFINSYSVTSLSEYWAVGFEKYYVGRFNEVKTTCPYLFMRIEEIEYESQ